MRSTTVSQCIYKCVITITITIFLETEDKATTINCHKLEAGNWLKKKIFKALKKDVEEGGVHKAD